MKKLESEVLASHQVQNLRDPLGRVSRMLESGVDIRVGTVDAEKLTELVYEADVLVDEAATHVAKPKVRSFACLYEKFERVRQELVLLAQTAADSASGSGEQSGPNPGTDVETSGCKEIQESIIVGRKSDKESIVNALLDTSNLQNNITDVAIVGMGGLGAGKTTLAQLVYTDKRVVDHFHLRLWVCVSKIIDIRNIIIKIVAGCLASTKPTIDGRAISELGLDRLTSLLEDAIREKVFLLVLDDVWNEGSGELLSLKRTLTVAPRGSKILFTTRVKRVADLCTRIFELRHIFDDEQSYNTLPSPLKACFGIRQAMNLSKFKRLRVLKLQAFAIQILPDSIGNLIHLSHLDLSRDHSLVKLPNSIADLYNLKRLDLSSCCDLKELPTNTRKLARLMILEIDGCEKLTFMPPGFEYLTSLQSLSRYVVGRPRFHSTSGFQALGTLNRLQGSLVIELSENWTAAVNDATKANLHSKTSLMKLAIKWGPARDTSKRDSLKHQTMLDGLQPPPNLKALHIEGYRGPDFPRWAKPNTLATALPELVTVSIDGSGQCKTLPPFSRLPHLRHLTLRFMGNVQFFENSDTQSSAPESQFFPALEELTLHGFYCLERWCKDETLVSSLSFDCLKIVKLWSCPKLESMPLFPDVEVLDLQNINKKLLEIPNVTTLPSSSSSEATNSVPRGHPQKLPLLKTLHVNGCPSLKTLALEKNSGKLKKLVVERLDMLNSLAEVLKQLTSLEELKISSCKDLDLSGGCQRSCGECEECGMPWKSLSTLRHLTLRELTKLVTLPVGLGSINTLKTICISACNNLSVLPEWVSKFTSLQHFRLESCLALSELPEKLKDIRSLVKVDIIECPKLMERCRKGGEDWHKIKHARVLCHKSWRYASMSEAELPQLYCRLSSRILLPRTFLLPKLTLVIAFLRNPKIRVKILLFIQKILLFT